VCDAGQLRGWAAVDAQAAPSGDAREFLAFCGVVGLGRLLTEGDASALDDLRRHANDSRWRVREAVAMAVQRWGADDFEAMAAAMGDWAQGSWLERRAAAAALCEPVLLTDPPGVRAVLGVLEKATAAVTAAGPDERGSDEFKAFRKGLGYCWSVAVAAAPETGRAAFEALVAQAAQSGDRDLRWIARQNLRKRRLERLDAGWAPAHRRPAGREGRSSGSRS
jgi:hypothetical protein